MDFPLLLLLLLAEAVLALLLLIDGITLTQQQHLWEKLEHWLDLTSPALAEATDRRGDQSAGRLGLRVL